MKLSYALYKVESLINGQGSQNICWSVAGNTNFVFLAVDNNRGFEFFFHFSSLPRRNFNEGGLSGTSSRIALNLNIVNSISIFLTRCIVVI
jgi:hypothetical protein